MSLREPDRAAFLDRDGTLIVERHYLSDPAKVELIPGTVHALRALKAAGWRLVIVTNQSGIARGFYGEEQFHAVQSRLEVLLLAEGIPIDRVYHCPHHPEITGPCDCRKPGPGMYQRAARELGVDLAASAYIGDRVADVEPASRFGGLGILVATGYGARDAAQAPGGTRTAADLAEAARIALDWARGNTAATRAND